MRARVLRKRTTEALDFYLLKVNGSLATAVAIIIVRRLFHTRSHHNSSSYLPVPSYGRHCDESTSLSQREDRWTIVAANQNCSDTMLPPHRVPVSGSASRAMLHESKQRHEYQIARESSAKHYLMMHVAPLASSASYSRPVYHAGILVQQISLFCQGE